jgi:plasmid replication initiation protein
MFTAAQVQQSDTSETKYCMTFQQFFDLCKMTEGGENYKRVFAEARKLTRLGIDFTDKNGDLVGFNWLASVRVSPKKGEVVYTISAELMPFYKTKQGTFAVIHLLDYMPLRSKYALMLYEFLAKWQNDGKVYQSIEQLREQLQVPDDLYPRTVDFLRRVVKGAVDEINEKASTAFTVKMFEQRVSNRKVTGIMFVIKPIMTVSAPDADLIELLIKQCKVEAAAAARIVNTYSRARIEANVRRALEINSQGKARKGLAAVACDAIAEDYMGIEQIPLFEAEPAKRGRPKKPAPVDPACPYCAGTGVIFDKETNNTSRCRCQPAPEMPDEDRERWTGEGADMIKAAFAEIGNGPGPVARPTAPVEEPEAKSTPRPARLAVEELKRREREREAAQKNSAPTEAQNEN